MNEQNVGVALAKEACPLCGALEDGPIIHNKQLTKSAAAKVEELHGKTIGYMDKPCKDCLDLMDKGILLIGVVEAKTTDIKDPYRSGNKWVISPEAAKRIFEQDGEKILEQGMAFLSVEAADQLGFPDVNLEA